ncbi:MAG: restriction endonuclease subunit S [Proteobacteria bacterium]|jgi:type I restriction enzyme S subunit|nr:restriction endonuclease subunit S [Pseudomonadota bacterium]
MGGDWETVPLESLIETGRGISYGIVQPGAAVPDGVPIVRVSDVRDGRIATASPLRVAPDIEAAYCRTRLAGGELLLTLVGTVGETAIVPKSLAGWNTARAVAVIPVRKEVNPYWVKLALRAPGVRAIIDSRLNTTVQATLNLGDVAQLPIVMPPLREREAIAHILGTLDDKIELNRRMNETLEAMARALFKSWFVDFDPVRAKAEGRDAGLPKEIAELFPARLVESELGEVPEGWRGGSLGDIAEHPRRGVQPDQIEPGTPYIALEHMPKRSIALSEWGTAETVGSNKYEFKRGEMLFGKLRPYFHKVGVAPVDGVCSTDIVPMVAREESWFGFVLGHVSSDAFVEHTSAGSTGTKMPRTSWAEMARYPVVIPQKAVCEVFTRQIRRSSDRIVASIHESRTLAAVRDSLLPKLISGEVRVKDIERVLEAQA